MRAAITEGDPVWVLSSPFPQGQYVRLPGVVIEVIEKGVSHSRTSCRSPREKSIVVAQYKSRCVATAQRREERALLVTKKPTRVRYEHSYLRYPLLPIDA